MDLMDLKIDPEFAEKIPPLTPEEFEQLEANILAEGTVLNPLIVWNGVIVDGHNRYKIIQAHPEISFTTHEKEFADRYEAIIWICRNQLGRRNLTDEQKKYLIGKQYEAEKAARGENSRGQPRDKTGKFHRNVQNEHYGSRAPSTTREKVAKENNVTGSFVHRADQFTRGLDAADAIIPGIRNEILSGTLKVPEKSVTAIARAAPDERPQLAEDLRKPRPSPKRKKPEPVETPVQTKYMDDTEESTPEDFPAGEPDKPWSEGEASDTDRPTSALAISENMASTPDRRNRDTPVETIIAELADALEGMIFRWDFCLTVNQPNASLEECRTQVRALAAKGIEYLNHIKEDK